MDKETLITKLLDLTEGRETPESWKRWWDNHESELEALLSHGEFLKLKPRKHGFQWVPVLTSQKGAIAILEKNGITFETSNLYQERYLAELDAFCAEQKRVQRDKQTKFKAIRSYLADTLSSPRRWQRCWTLLTRSSLPPLRSKSEIKKACWTSHSRLRCGSFSC